MEGPGTFGRLKNKVSAVKHKPTEIYLAVMRTGNAQQQVPEICGAHWGNFHRCFPSQKDPVPN